MKLENGFRVDVPMERAWELLTDIPQIAPCMPGAKLTSSDGDVHKGSVKIKVGPITAEYLGAAEVVERDESARRVEIKAKGRDKRGAGNASAHITAQMKSQGDATEVTIDTDLQISGKVAQFGRGVIADVSAKLIDQFVDCIEQKLLASEVPEQPVDGDTESEPADTAGSAVSEVSRGQARSDATSVTQGIKGIEEEDAEDTSEPEALDLLDVAGGALVRRLIPVVAILVLALVLLLFVLL